VVLRDLARTADGLTCNLRGDVPGKLGLTYEALGEVNPRIVCAHLTAYGRDGPRAAWPGYDYLMQAETGYLTVTGEPGTPPARMGLSIVDFMTGLNMSLALLAAVLKARETGVGRDIDVSLFDTALFNLSYLAAWNLATGECPGRAPRSAHPVITPCQLYRAKDGWIFIMCNKEKFWGTLCRAVGRPEWAEDPRFRFYPERLANRELLTEMLDEVLGERTPAQWIESFGGRVPAAPVLDVAAALANPFVTEGGRIQTLRDEKSGRDFRLLAQPIRTAGETPPNRAAPVLGADTVSILEGLGYDAGRIAGLRRAGVI
jgi:crotonobetainyl-CoA:carnitine CoA-transferase CaiB-like acyl-CoA transferase